MARAETRRFNRCARPTTAGLTSVMMSVMALMAPTSVRCSSTRSAATSSYWRMASSITLRNCSGAHGFVRKRKIWPSLIALIAAAMSA
jgi:hypothetical protein